MNIASSRSSRPAPIRGLPLVLLALLLAACGVLGKDPWSTVDSWYHPFKAFAPSIAPLPADQVHLVRSGALPEAEHMLAEVPIVQLSPSEAEGLVGHPVYVGPELQPFLLRGVYLTTPDFFVKQNNEQVWVGSRGVGDKPVPMKRHAVVAVLYPTPTAIYVTAGER